MRSAVCVADGLMSGAMRSTVGVTNGLTSGTMRSAMGVADGLLGSSVVHTRIKLVQGVGLVRGIGGAGAVGVLIIRVRVRTLLSGMRLDVILVGAVARLGAVGVGSL